MIWRTASIARTDGGAMRGQSEPRRRQTDRLQGSRSWRSRSINPEAPAMLRRAGWTLIQHDVHLPGIRNFSEYPFLHPGVSFAAADLPVAGLVSSAAGLPAAVAAPAVAELAAAGRGRAATALSAAGSELVEAGTAASGRRCAAVASSVAGLEPAAADLPAARSGLAAVELPAARQVPAAADLPVASSELAAIASAATRQVTAAADLPVASSELAGVESPAAPQVPAAVDLPAASSGVAAVGRPVPCTRAAGQAVGREYFPAGEQGGPRCLLARHCPASERSR